jgi:hypothetical protein
MGRMTHRARCAVAWAAMAMLSTLFAVACGSSSGGSNNSGLQAEGGADGSTDGAADVVDASEASTPDSTGGDSAQEATVPEGGPADTGVLDAPEQPDGPFAVAPHSGPVVTNNGGPTIAHPLLVTISYADDTSRSVEEALGSFLPQSNWLTTVGAEYGVGAGTSVNVELTQNAPATIDDSGIQSFIASLITSGMAPDPLYPDGGAPDGAASDGGAAAGYSNAIYMIYFPQSTMVTVANTGLCQYSSGGYHYESSVMANGHSFAYAVVSPCPNGLPAAYPDNYAWAASHEFIEASTDPYVLTAPGYILYDYTRPWTYIGGEVGDLCTFVLPQWSEGAYTAIQRVYSNKSAMAGGSPCIPSSEPYYAVDGEPQTFVALSAGQQATFQLKGWSTAPVPAWTLSTYAYPVQGMASPSLTLGSSTMQNGQTTTLTFGMPAGTPSGTYVDVIIYSMASQTDYTASVVGAYVP